MEDNKKDKVRLCDYGCGQEASFQLKNGKWCCSKSSNSCPSMKARNSKSTKERHQRGEGFKFSDEDRRKSRISHYSNDAVKNLLVNAKGWELKCHSCGIKEWFGKLIPIELNHIDGNTSNNEVNNLEFLCPNCHSITDNWRGKNINKGHKKVSDEDLIEALSLTSSIRKALQKVGLTAKGGNYSRCYNLLYKKN